MRPPGQPGNRAGLGAPPGNGGGGVPAGTRGRGQGNGYNLPCFQPPQHPPFRPQADDDPNVDPRDERLAAMIANAIRSGVQQDDKLNY